jgi:hypothetical protein
MLARKAAAVSGSDQSRKYRNNDLKGAMAFIATPIFHLKNSPQSARSEKKVRHC